jgi:hypothetical protein
VVPVQLAVVERVLVLVLVNQVALLVVAMLLLVV